MRHTARRRSAILGLALVVVLAIASLAIAHEVADMATQLTIAAREADDCSDGSSYCFVVTEGNLSELGPNTTVRLTFVDEGTMVHNVAVTRLRDADPSHEETSMEGMFAGTAERIEANSSQTFFFHIPADAQGVYLWCHVTAHEKLGMWLQTAFDGDADDVMQDETHDDSHDDRNMTDDGTDMHDNGTVDDADATGDGAQPPDDGQPATPGFQAIGAVAAVGAAAWLIRRRR